MTRRFLIAAALLASGCVAPKVLFSEEVIGDRSAEFLMQRSSSIITHDGQGNSQSKGLYDYSVRLCDYNQAGQPTNCNDTLILTNVSYHPLK